MRPASIKFLYSSGGVIYRKVDSLVEVALIAVRDGNVWSLPKGLVDRGEGPEETALREVREETGLSGRIVEKIGSITYWYFIKEENSKCKKTVTYYLMEYLGGRTEDHDYEVDDSAWFPIDDAHGKVAYKGDREIIVKARDLILEHERKSA